MSIAEARRAPGPAQLGVSSPLLHQPLLEGERGMAISAAATESGTRTGHKIKTSVAAVFALVFGVCALVCALTVLLSPAALVLGVIALILAAAGLAMSRRPHVTGKGVAIGGLVTGLLALIVSGALIGGAATVLNNRSAVARLDKQVQKLKDKLPNKVPSQITNK